jgi:hypothetical protein
MKAIHRLRLCYNCIADIIRDIMRLQIQAWLRAGAVASSADADFSNW